MSLNDYSSRNMNQAWNEKVTFQKKNRQIYVKMLPSLRPVASADAARSLLMLLKALPFFHIYFSITPLVGAMPVKNHDV